MLGSDYVSDSSFSEADLMSCLKYCSFSITYIVWGCNN